MHTGSCEVLRRDILKSAKHKTHLLNSDIEVALSTLDIKDEALRAIMKEAYIGSLKVGNSPVAEAFVSIRNKARKGLGEI